MNSIHILGLSLTTIILIVLALIVGKKWGASIPLISNV
jgi:hypothetical protein